MERRTFVTGIATLVGYANVPSALKPSPVYADSISSIPLLVDIVDNVIKSHRVIPDSDFDPTGNLTSKFSVKGRDKDRGLILLEGKDGTLWSVELPKGSESGLYLLNIAPEPLKGVQRKEPELLEDYNRVALSVDERVAAIRNYLKWIFKPQLSGCFDNLEIIAQEGYNFYGTGLSYGLGRVTANSRSVVAFSKEADGWSHEGFHHIDLFCKATDNRMFRADYEKLPKDNEFRQLVEGAIKQHYSEITTHTQEDLWVERRGFTMQLYFNPKFRPLIPQPMVQFLEKYVQSANLPKDDYFRVSLKDFFGKK